MKPNKGITYILNRNHQYLENLPEEWCAHLGRVGKRFTMLVVGKPKNGKTDYMVKFSKALAQYEGKVLYNSAEEGDGPTIQEAIQRNHMEPVTGKWMLSEDKKFEDLVKRLKRKNSGRFIVIDSRDYMKLTADQYIELKETFRYKSIIVICWGTPGNPLGAEAKAIEYMVDIVVGVTDFIAQVKSRFGGNEPFIISADQNCKALAAKSKAKKNPLQPSLFES